MHKILINIMDEKGNSQFPNKNTFFGVMEDVFAKIVEECELSEEDMKTRQKVLQNLESFINRTLNVEIAQGAWQNNGTFITKRVKHNAQLSLFGSSANGFGSKKSDIDISLVFENLGADCFNFKDIVKQLAQCLKPNESLTNVEYVPARVPIVKFHHISSSLDGDISLYNMIAQRNTALLRAYSEIDPRVKALGCIMKKFVKICNICDASNGYLSSYAYTLMVIYFLQQRRPPVVPVLQAYAFSNKSSG